MTLLIVFVVVLGLMLLFDVLTRKYLNPYRLYLVFGKKGSGKSTYLVKLSRNYLRKGWVVYTNMDDLLIDGVRIINITHVGDYVPCSNSVLLLDEVGMVWDARDYKMFKPTVRDFFKYQRHYQCVVYLASQTFDVDKKIRDLCDGMFLHTCIARVFSLGKRITKKIVLLEATTEGESRISDSLTYCPPWEWTLTLIPRYAKYFNSHALLDRPELPYTLVTIDPQGPVDDLPC